MNTLLKDQNSKPLIRLLKAQRIAYDNAKQYQFIDLVSVLIALSPTALLFVDFKEVDPNLSEMSKLSKITSIIAVIGVLWTLLSIFAQSIMDRQTKEGAIIQDQFDSTLFKLDRNKILVEKWIETSQIVSLSKKYKKEDLKDWYSINIPDNIDNDASVLLAYKCNSIFAKAQRKKYVIFIQVMIFLYYGILLSLSFVNEILVFDLILLFAPSTPALIFATLTIKAQKGILSNYEKINNLVENLFSEYKTTKKVPSKSELRQIQDLFYTQRLIASKVPTWFYRIFKSNTEDIVNESISIMTNE
ncbi:S-4TM family putative pore-forming effector [Flavicella sp.]|uniref:S-4TM family putative pore-forming effector n=1 Tax=Flavicella sp. TaxID=2957742 RepID=UPI00301AE7FA